MHNKQQNTTMYTYHLYIDMWQILTSSEVLTRSIADMWRVILVHEPVRSIVNGQTKYTHVICVEHPIQRKSTEHILTHPTQLFQRYNDTMWRQ